MIKGIRARAASLASDVVLFRRAAVYVLPYWQRLVLAGVCAVFMSIAGGMSAYSVLPIMQVALEADREQNLEATEGASDQGGEVTPTVVIDPVGETTVIGRWLNRQFDRVSSGGSQLTRLVSLASLAFGLLLASQLVAALLEMIFASIQAGGVKRFRIATFSHLNRLPLTYFNKNKAGIIIARVENDLGGAIQMVTGSMLVVFMHLFMAVVLTTLLISTSPRLVLVALPVAVLASLFSSFIAGWVRRLRTRIQANVADIVVILQEFLAGVRVIRAFSREDYEISKFEAQIERGRKLEIRNVLAKALLPRGVNLASAVAIAVVFVYGGALMIDGVLGVGQLILFAFLLQRLQVPGMALVNAYATAQGGLAYAERSFDLMDAPEQEAAGVLEVKKVSDRIAFRGVAFDYGEGPVLQGIDLELPVGSMVALVGPSGVGKSTMGDLLIRFYDPVEGSITLDGADIREFDLASYRSLFGMVTQDTFLFHDTVKFNIAYGSDTASLGQVEAAARVADADGFIRNLPKGYETVIGDRGVRLSGGQRQRIAIARAVLKNPPILILDEATSSLDTEAERQVQKAIDRLIEGRTVLVIAHRLSTVRRADNIVVLDRGRIVEKGRHAELLALGGQYKRLYALQFEDAGAEDNPSQLLGAR